MLLLRLRYRATVRTFAEYDAGRSEYQIVVRPSALVTDRYEQYTRRMKVAYQYDVQHIEYPVNDRQMDWSSQEHGKADDMSNPWKSH